jgi:UDP-N-acetylmuramate dehydrogenase
MLNGNCLQGDLVRNDMTRLQGIEGLRGKLRHNEPMSRHTSWRVGGPADRFYIPADLDDLRLFLGHLSESEPVFWIGLGSNLLVRDGGIRGTVIATKNVMDKLDKMEPNRIRAGAGVPCAKLARYSVKAGCTGAEFLVGIPGTLGGALAMNAGAFGGETWDIVDRVATIDRQGRLHSRGKPDFTIAYRSVTRPGNEWFVSAELVLKPDDARTGHDTIRDLLNRRGATQPMGEASCGSVFRNPGKDQPAARLIESSGLKQARIGGAGVSGKHANFIINLGGATAADIEKLIEHVQRVVYEKHRIALCPEVQIIGEAA